MLKSHQDRCLSTRMLLFVKHKMTGSAISYHPCCFRLRGIGAHPWWRRCQPVRHTTKNQSTETFTCPKINSRLSINPLPWARLGQGLRHRLTQKRWPGMLGINAHYRNHTFKTKMSFIAKGTVHKAQKEMKALMLAASKWEAEFLST